MADEQAYFSITELTRIKLEPGEILSVKLFGDEYTSKSVAQLDEQLRLTFPNNKIMMFWLPSGHDIQLEAISALKDREDKAETAYEASKAIADIMNNTSCSTAPKGYCGDCSCGKKEAAEAKNESES